jgi:hypothetical protein
LALIAEDLKSEMLSATENLEDASLALTALGEAISLYFINNAEFSFSWNGITPGSPPVVDPVVSASGGIISLVITLTASGADFPGGGLAQLGSEIQAGVASGQFNVTDPGFALSPGVMVDIPPLSLSLGGEDIREDAFASLADQIINWLTGYVPAAILLGSHGSYAAPPGSGAAVLSIS